MIIVKDLISFYVGMDGKWRNEIKIEVVPRKHNSNIKQDNRYICTLILL